MDRMMDRFFTWFASRVSSLVGQPGAFTRTSRRHDYALEPPVPTVLDHLTAAGHPVIAIGKIKDLFAGRGVTRHLATASDDEGMDRVEEAMRDVPRIGRKVPLTDALQALSRDGGAPAVAVEDEGRLVGLITPANVADLIALKA